MSERQQQAEQLEQNIAALERALKRERAARQEAESQLEDYSREIYQSNQLLQEQTKQAHKKQQHLAFLMSVAEDNWQSKTISALLNNYLNTCGQFASQSICVFFQLENDNEISRVQVVNNPEQQSELDLSKEVIEQILAAMNKPKLNAELTDLAKGKVFWLSDYLIDKKITEEDHQVFLIPIYQSKTKTQAKLGCLCFIYPAEHQLETEKLATIEASHAIFAVALEQKKADAVLKRKLIELQQSNAELTQTQQQLVESEKLASLGQLSAGVAHEINNPVGFVLSNLATMTDYFTDLKQALEPLHQHDNLSAELLHKWQKNSEEFETSFLLEDGAEILASSLEGLERVKSIVADLGIFARMDSHELDKIALDQVILSALNIINNEFKYEHSVATELEPDSLILGNAGQLQQVFINFLINAKHAMADGGEIQVSCKQDNDKVLVKIKDQGHGIAPENLKNIFTPFFTTKPPGQGTGLGLSISYSILQRHDAEIKVNSEVGKGTEFILAFASTS